MANYTRNTLTGDLAPVNAELEKVQQSIADKLDRNPSTGQANQLGSTLDANNNRIINLPAPSHPNDPARLKDLTASTNSSILPPQESQTNKYLRTDGSAAYWDVIVKATVGLSDVDNTSDVNKPISTLTQNALDLKINVAITTTSLISSTVVYEPATVINTSGFATSGDTLGAGWKQNGVTSQPVSQSPLQLNGFTLNDANGNQWSWVGGAVASNMTILIPSMFSTLQAAIDFIHPKANISTGILVNLQIESSHTEATGLLITGGDYSHFVITSVDATVPVSIQNNGNQGFDGKGSHFFFENCTTPIFSCLFDAQTSGGRYAAGITVRNGVLRVDAGAGLINVGMPQLTASPANTLETQFGYNCLVWNNSRALLNGAVFTGAAQRNLWVTRSSFVTAATAILSGSRADGSVTGNDGNIYCTRGSHINAEYADLKNAANRAITCTRSFVNAEEADTSGTTNEELVVGRGGVINAFGTKTSNATGSSFPYTPSVLDLGGNSEFNTPNGSGIIYSEQASQWPSRLFSTQTLDVRQPTGGLEVSTRTNITLVFVDSSELAGTITFADTFLDTNYSAVSAMTVAPPSPRRAAGVMRFRNKTTTSITASLFAESGTFVSGDTCQITAQLLGRWK
jgi:hypothetical protein